MRKILYVGEYYFSNQIHRALYGSSYLGIHSKSSSSSLIKPDLNAVVLIGPQESQFGSEQEFYRWLQAVNKKNVPAVLVKFPGQGLPPRGREGLKEVIDVAESRRENSLQVAKRIREILESPTT